MRRLHLFVFLGLALLLAAASSARAATTLGSIPGNNTLQPFGEPSTTTYGQTITAPAGDNVLTGFRFQLNDVRIPDATDFQAYVFAWDGTKATGSPLYSSAPMSTTNNGGLDGLEDIVINTGNLPLTSGAAYVLTLSATNQLDGSPGHSEVGLFTFDQYAGGAAVTIDNGSDFSMLTSTAWSITPWDIAFNANFVPEPSTLILGLLGAAALGSAGFARRRFARRDP